MRKYGFSLTPLFFSTFIYADASLDIFDLSLEELQSIQVVTAAAGFEQNIKKAPASVTVIEAAEWQAQGAQNVTEALRGVLGLDISVISVGFARNKYNIRGLSGDFGQQVKFLVDGVPINRVWEGGLLVSPDLPLLGFKRIEFIRSPGSVVYGADAFGGTINLVSWEKGEQPNEVRVAAGDFDSYNIGVTHLWQDNDKVFQFAINYHHYGEDPDRTVSRDVQSLFDDIFGTNASLAPGVIDNSYSNLTVKASLSGQNYKVNYYGIDSTVGYGGGVAQALDPGKGYNENHIISAQYDLSTLIEGEFTLNAWYQHKNQLFPYKIFPAGSVIPIGADGNADFANPTTVALFTEGFIGEPSLRTHQYHVDVTHLYQPHEDHQLRWSVGFEYMDFSAGEKKNFGPGVLNGTETVVDGTLTQVRGTDYIYAADLHRSFSFFSFQDEWRINDRLQLNLGFRVDDYSNFGTTFNPRIGLMWDISEKTTLRLFRGTAFRAPSVADVGARNNPASLGNPDLTPEEIVTYEAAIDYQLSAELLTSLTAFQYKANELIDFVSEPNSALAKAQNIGELKGFGIEWEMHWRPTSSLDVKANYSRLSSEDANERDSADVANQLANIMINWKISPDLHTNVIANRVMDRNRAQGDLREKIKDYTWLSARVSYLGLAKNIEIALKANNLLDDDFAANPSTGSIPEDYPLAGRQWMLEFNYLF